MSFLFGVVSFGISKVNKQKPLEKRILMFLLQSFPIPIFEAPPEGLMIYLDAVWF